MAYATVDDLVKRFGSTELIRLTTPADQEIEFASHIGTVDVKYRFRLKDMVFRGKLEL